MPYVGSNPKLAAQNSANSARRTRSRGPSIGGPAGWKAGTGSANSTPRSTPTAGGGEDPYMAARRAANILDFVDKYMKEGLTFEQASERVARNLMRSGTVSTKDVNSTMAKYVHAAYGKIPGHSGVQKSFQERHGDKFAAKPSKDIQPKSGVPAYAEGIPNPSPPPAPPYPIGGGGSLQFQPPSAVRTMEFRPERDAMGPVSMGPTGPNAPQGRADLLVQPQPPQAGGGYSQYARQLQPGSSFRNDVARLTAPAVDAVEGGFRSAGNYINNDLGKDLGNLAESGIGLAQDVLVSPLDRIKDLFDWGNDKTGDLYDYLVR